MDLGCGVVLHGVGGNVPIRKLKDAALGLVPAELGADRSYLYLLQEEKLRQRMWRLNSGVYPESTSSEASMSCYSPTPQPAASPPPAAAADHGSGAWSPRSPRSRRSLSTRRDVGHHADPNADDPACVGSPKKPIVNLADSSVQCTPPVLVDAAAQTMKTLELYEQDELITYQQLEIKRLQDRIATLKTAALSRALSMRDELAAANRDFIAEHTTMFREEVKKRKVFETAALLSLRALERERAKDSKRAVCEQPNNAYDSKVAMMRLSVPDIALHPHMQVPVDLAAAVHDVSDYSAYDEICDYEAFRPRRDSVATSHHPITPVSALDLPGMSGVGARGPMTHLSLSGAPGPAR